MPRRKGRFVGLPVKVEWVIERPRFSWFRRVMNALLFFTPLSYKGSRKMRLLESISYIDPWGLIWEAPAGSIIDGASIPVWFWAFIDPFVGDYREASVIHDVACDRKKRPSWLVHRMFLTAMLCRGTNTVLAYIMWFMVRFVGGPRFSGRGLWS